MMSGKLMIGAGAVLLVAGGILISGGSGAGTALIAVAVIFLAIGAGKSKKG